ncbi:ion channel [Coleofasciculus sp.]|uniref:ion channel n=1 Tax=Coleofasciculus sp. TaxID=3100458 RepID=UPI003A191648
MSILLVISGLLILIVVSIDVLITTLTVGGGGPLTSRISAWLWKIALTIHRWRSHHRLLVVTGWIVLVSVAVLWFVLTWMGWTLLFSADETAVVTPKKLPATTLERIYFVGYTISTLGMGSYSPQGAVWQVATAIASVNGFFLVTLAIAYLLPVVSAATQQRQLAVYISALGGTADEILVRAWNGEDFGQFDQHLIALTPMLAQQGERHLTYPILHYFHSIERSRSIKLSLVALDEALTILEYGVKKSNQPDPAALGAARRASAAYLKTLKSAYLKPASQNPPLPSLERLRRQGIPTVSDRQFWDATKQVTKRRRLLLALIHNDGWVWDAIASSQTTNRATTLDDQTTIDKVILH